MRNSKFLIFILTTTWAFSPAWAVHIPLKKIDPLEPGTKIGDPGKNRPVPGTYDFKYSKEVEIKGTEPTELKNLRTSIEKLKLKAPGVSEQLVGSLFRLQSTSNLKDWKEYADAIIATTRDNKFTEADVKEILNSLSSVNSPGKAYLATRLGIEIQRLGKELLKDSGIPAKAAGATPFHTLKDRVNEGINEIIRGKGTTSVKLGVFHSIDNEAERRKDEVAHLYDHLKDSRNQADLLAHQDRWKEQIDKIETIKNDLNTKNTAEKDPLIKEQNKEEAALYKQVCSWALSHDPSLRSKLIESLAKENPDTKTSPEKFHQLRGLQILDGSAPKDTEPHIVEACQSAQNGNDSLWDKLKRAVPETKSEKGEITYKLNEKLTPEEKKTLLDAYKNTAEVWRYMATAETDEMKDVAARFFHLLGHAGGTPENPTVTLKLAGRNEWTVEEKTVEIRQNDSLGTIMTKIKDSGADPHRFLIIAPEPPPLPAR